MKRPKKFTFDFKSIIRDLWTHIYGIITVLSFIVAFIFAIITSSKDSLEFKDILYALLCLIVVLTIVLMRISAKYAQLHSMSADLLNYERENENLITLIQLQSETTHNITHYYRSLIYSFDLILDKINRNETISQEEIEYILERNNNFLIVLTSSLQNYFSIYTDDNCAISLKLLSPDGKKVKTLFRDPINLKKRRQAELLSSINVYNVYDNTAFEIITSDKYKDYFFACDNLEDLYNKHLYKNANLFWNNFYNSTIVTPISKLNSQTERNIVGFLTVDNMKGYLVDNTSIEYLLGISDLLYLYINKFKEISEYTINKKIKNERASDFIFG